MVLPKHRWANIDNEYVPEQEEPSVRKKAKAAAAERLDGLADGLDDLLHPGKRGAARPVPPLYLDILCSICITSQLGQMILDVCHTNCALRRD